MKKTSEKININEHLEKLQKIVAWFESEKELDLEKALHYVKEGGELIKTSRERLREIENEFKEIKKEIQKSE